MRQWMCDPEIMCTQHLLGEHVEHHMFAGTINKGTSVQGYLDKNLLQPMSLINRHQELVREMVRRGMNHQSPLPHIELSLLTLDQRNTIIDRRSALNDLISRCPKCRERKRKKESNDPRMSV